MLKDGPYRFFFYSADGGEPPHIHVVRDIATAKFWLEPVSLVKNDGFRGVEIRDIERVVKEQATVFLVKWHEYFEN